MIEAAGFIALEASNADEAIEILESRDDIRVMFTDIQMPGSMDGLKLAQAVRGRWPPIEIVATSGRVMLGEHDLPARGRFVPKPYSAARDHQDAERTDFVNRPRSETIDPDRHPDENARPKFRKFNSVRAIAALFALSIGAT